MSAPIHANTHPTRRPVVGERITVHEFYATIECLHQYSSMVANAAIGCTWIGARAISMSLSGPDFVPMKKQDYRWTTIRLMVVVIVGTTVSRTISQILNVVGLTILVVSLSYPLRTASGGDYTLSCNHHASYHSAASVPCNNH